MEGCLIVYLVSWIEYDMPPLMSKVSPSIKSIVGTPRIEGKLLSHRSYVEKELEKIGPNKKATVFTIEKGRLKKAEFNWKVDLK